MNTAENASVYRTEEYGKSPVLSFRGMPRLNFSTMRLSIVVSELLPVDCRPQFTNHTKLQQS